MYDAEAKPSCASPSWTLPRRGSASGSMRLCMLRSALQYSTPRISFGEMRIAASSPNKRCAASCRAAAKEPPSVRRSRSAVENSSLSSPSATRLMRAPSAHSLPKQSVSTTPVLSSTSTPPRAKPSADEIAQGSGSSSTRSAPPRSAASARRCFSAMAKSPRWTKLPLMAHTTAVSAPKRSRSCARSQACPRWNGLYSQIIPTVLMKILSKQ